MKNYVSLDYVFAHAIRSPVFPATFEDRPRRYKFGTWNYGDIPGLYNRADGDPWDVFAPGYGRMLPIDRPYRIKDVLGYFRLENGNHKIAIRLYVSGYDARRAAREIRRYCTEYSRCTGKRGTWVPLRCDDDAILRRA